MPTEARARRATAILDLVLHAGLALAALAGIYLLAFERPVAYVTFVTEDYWAEYATAIACLVTSLLMAYWLWVDREARLVGVVLIALAAFLVGMEEVSWGQRILGLATPETMAAHNLQGELNVHNLVGTKSYMSLVPLLVFGYAFVLPWLAPRWPVLARLCRRLGVPLVQARYVPCFALALIFLSFSRRSLGLLRVSEIGELALALAMCMAMMGHVVTARREPMPGPFSMAGISLAVAAASFLLAAPLVRNFDRPESLRKNLAHYASLELPEMNMMRQSQALFDHLEAHAELRDDSFHADRAVVYREMGDEAAARATLEEGLEQQRALERERPADAGPPRVVGRVLRLLGRHDEARAAFARALSIDHERLRDAAEAAVEAEVRWSIAKTRHAMYEVDEAEAELALALDVAPSRADRSRMRRWLMREDAKGRFYAR